MQQDQTFQNEHTRRHCFTHPISIQDIGNGNSRQNGKQSYNAKSDAEDDGGDAVAIPPPKEAPSNPKGEKRRQG